MIQQDECESILSNSERTHIVENYFFNSVENEYGKSISFIPRCLFGIGDIVNVIFAPLVNAACVR